MGRSFHIKNMFVLSNYEKLRTPIRELKGFKAYAHLQKGNSPIEMPYTTEIV